MIVLYTGVPGSGKSYKMVHDLSVFLDKNPDITLISNIRNLKLGHINFDDYLDELFPGLKRSQKIENFFNYEHQQALNEQFGGPIMYVLDECQLYFPRRASLPETESYLQRHRHLGHYIYLATQHSKLINANFVPLIETEFHAARRTISFMGEIHYKEKSPQTNQITRKITLRPKKEIFNLYQSFETAEIKKPRPVLFTVFIIPLLLTPFFYLFYDKYLRVPEKEISRPASVSSAPSPELEKLRRELEELRVERSSLVTMIEKLSFENASLRESAEQTVRVLLPVVHYGDKKLTVDPETGAVVEVTKLKGRKVVCINGDTTCYYDRPVTGGVQFYTDPNSPQYSPLPPIPSIQEPPRLPAGPGSFIDSSMFEEIN